MSDNRENKKRINLLKKVVIAGGLVAGGAVMGVGGKVIYDHVKNSDKDEPQKDPIEAEAPQRQGNLTEVDATQTQEQESKKLARTYYMNIAQALERDGINIEKEGKPGEPDSLLVKVNRRSVFTTLEDGNVTGSGGYDGYHDPEYVAKTSLEFEGHKVAPESIQEISNEWESRSVKDIQIHEENDPEHGRIVEEHSTGRIEEAEVLRFSYNAESVYSNSEKHVNVVTGDKNTTKILDSFYTKKGGRGSK